MSGSPTYDAPGWDALLIGLRAQVQWSIDRTVELMLALPSFADLDDASIRPVVERNHDATLAGLESRRRPGPADLSERFVRGGAERAVQGVSASDLAAAWRIGQESVYQLALKLVDGAPGRDRLLLGFLDLLMSWVDFAMFNAAEGHRTQELSEVTRLMQEQAALRRVATMVAREARRAEVFSAVADGSAALFGTADVHLVRFDGDVQKFMAASGPLEHRYPIGGARPLDEQEAAAIVLRTGRAARVDQRVPAESHPGNERISHAAVHSVVAAPVTLERGLWGALVIESVSTDRLPEDTEARLVNFSDLMAICIANARARRQGERLGREQAALRRVATMVARERLPAEVLASVANELGVLLGVESATIVCYGTDNDSIIVAVWGTLSDVLEVGTRRDLIPGGVFAEVHRTKRPVRFDGYEDAWGSLEPEARALGLSSLVASPVIVDGGLWGAIVAATSPERPMPVEAEEWIAQFTDLVATGIANMQARSDLADSRARIVAAGDEERRRVVRDLHDGAQQRLVHTILSLKHARRALESGRSDSAALVDEAIGHAEAANDEIRELAHGILPSVLALGGLRASVKTLASRMPIPIHADVLAGRLPGNVEATAYFLLAEALTNVAKHAQASRATVTARMEKQELCLEVQDDGIGGVNANGGLIGLRDRVAALEGTLQIDSRKGHGTRITAHIPVPAVKLGARRR